MLLAALYISDAGYARWLGDSIHAAVGGGPWPFMVPDYLANDLSILALGAYDLVTRRGLHPAYVVGACWVLVLQLTAGVLYTSPAWKQVALALIGHRPADWRRTADSVYHGRKSGLDAAECAAGARFGRTYWPGISSRHWPRSSTRA